MTSTSRDQPGYLSPDFGASYRFFGPVIRLPRTGLQLLKRPITDDYFDLVGVYPYAMCVDWSGLNRDVDALCDGHAVSLVFVGDPFETELLQTLGAGWECIRHFKSHYVVDLTVDWRGNRSRKGRQLANRALRHHATAVADDPTALAPRLWELYQTTISRKQVTGIQRLSLETVRQQLALPGTLLVTAEDEHGLAGGMLAYDHGATAACHLMFLSERAHRQSTTYGLLHCGMAELETRGCQYANLGGTAGLTDDPKDGLAIFKRHWARQTRSALLCGRVLNAAAYRSLANNVSDGDHYFPSYRAPGVGVASE